eukprot:5607913-Amphidinium_carterae.1
MIGHPDVVFPFVAVLPEQHFVGAVSSNNVGVVREHIVYIIFRHCALKHDLVQESACAMGVRLDSPPAGQAFDPQVKQREEHSK